MSDKYMLLVRGAPALDTVGPGPAVVDVADEYSMVSVWREPALRVADVSDEYSKGGLEVLWTGHAHERVQWDYERTWEPGTASPGVKRISFLRRRPELTLEEFADHWDRVHTPIARAHHPGVWRYVQNVVDASEPEDGIDGVAELHFRTRDDLAERFYATPESRDAVAADVRKFILLRESWNLLATEYVVPA